MEPTDREDLEKSAYNIVISSKQDKGGEVHINRPKPC